MGIINWTLRRADKRRIQILTNECRDKTVLDVGFRSMLDPLTISIINVAKSWYGIDESPEKPPKTGYSLGRFEETVLDERFDVVLLGEVLEHSDSPGAMIVSAKRHLKKGGAILFSTPNPEWYLRGFFIAAYPILSFLRRIGVIKMVSDEHLMWFCSWTMENLARRYGLEIRWLGRLWWPSLIGEMK